MCLTSKVSSCASRWAILRSFIMSKKLQKTCRLRPTNERLKKFNDHRTFHACNGRKTLFDGLPEIFFNDANSVFEGHFVHKWISTKFLMLSLASIPPTSTALTRWLLSMPENLKYLIVIRTKKMLAYHHYHRVMKKAHV